MLSSLFILMCCTFYVLYFAYRIYTQKVVRSTGRKGRMATLIGETLILPNEVTDILSTADHSVLVKILEALEQDFK